MKRYRIGILGIGGTGGFFGGKLAVHYAQSEKVEVIFIARNKTREAIIKNGLKVESIEGDFSVRPSLTSDDPEQIGELDILLVCVKSLGLEKAINQYIHNVRKGGVVITIQNLVNQAERVVKLLPENVSLLEGCAYIISNIVDYGHIKHRGGAATIYFGKNDNIEGFEWIEKLLINAGIKATLSNDISKIIWKKFLFISPLAVATSYFSCTIGELRNDPDKLFFLNKLMKELFRIIDKKNIGLKGNVIEDHMQTISGLPEHGKTSLQLDIEKNIPSEIDSLLVYVVEEAKHHNVQLNNYPMALDKLKDKK